MGLLKQQHGWTHLRWCWRSTGTVPFYGVCWFNGTVILGLWPLTIEVGRSRSIEWTRTPLDGGRQ